MSFPQDFMENAPTTIARRWHEVEEETRTIETRLCHRKLYPVLDELLSYFARFRYRLWRDLIIKCMPINELKRSYIADFGAKARQFNSLAKKQSLEEIAKERSAKLDTGKRSITKAEKTISQCHKDLKSIQS